VLQRGFGGNSPPALPTSLRLVEVPNAFGGTLVFRWGPVFRIGRDPAVCLFLGRKIAHIGSGAISSTYGNGPTTVLDHFRVKLGFLAHLKNTRLQQNGSIPIATKLSPTRRPIDGAGICGLNYLPNALER
jgi:hypothetical protein